MRVRYFDLTNSSKNHNRFLQSSFVIYNAKAPPQILKH